MKLFVKIKHWQLFLVLILLGNFFLRGNTDRLTFLIWGTIFLAIYSAWLYSISVIGQKKLTAFNLHKNTNWLQASCFLAPPLWLVITGSPYINITWYRIMMGFIAVCVLACWIYSIYFTAKTIITLEKQRVPKFQEYILIILGLVIIFWLIGLWFIQPKVNKTCT